jgi:predicted amidohydrolase
MVFYDHLDYVGEREGWHAVGQTIDVDETTPELNLNLFYSWEVSGKVLWGDPRLYDITELGTSRPVTLAAISGNPQKPGSPAECIEFYCEKLNEISEADLVVLPELINVTRLDMPLSDLAEPIPGPTYEYLSEQARSHGFYIAASLLEREGDALYNTGILIDRTGGMVGRYRKTHLAPGEDLLQGTTPGSDYPIFETDFGKVGYMICYDAHFPEVARILSLKGADVIIFSNMGDGREGGSLWEDFIRMRALDNQVHIVAAVNGGRSCVVSPKGEILAMSDRDPGAWVSSQCDLENSATNSSGRPIRGRYNLYRRAETFGSLGRPLWEQ